MKIRIWSGSGRWLDGTGLFGGERLRWCDGSQASVSAGAHSHHSVSNLGYMGTRRRWKLPGSVAWLVFGAAE